MNANQDAHLAMSEVLIEQFENNALTVAKIPLFDFNVKALQDKVSNILSLAQIEESRTTGITIDKGTAKTTLAEIAYSIASPLYAYAISVGNNTLAEKVNYTLAELKNTPDDKIVIRTREIYNLASDNKTQLVNAGVTDVMIKELNDAIKIFENANPKTRQAITTRKSAGSEIDELFKSVDNIIKNQLDKLVIGFKTSDPGFYKDYWSNREIIDPGHTSTSIKGIIKSDEGEPLTNAKVSVLINEEIVQVPTNEKGGYWLKDIPFGTYEVTIQSPGYVTKVLPNIKVKKGKITRLSISLTSAG